MTIRRLGIAAALALVAGTVAVLGLTAASRAWSDLGAALLLALAAVWLPCTLTLTVVLTRRPR